MTSVLEPTSHNQQNLEADPKLQEALALKVKGKEHLTSTQYKEAVVCFNKAIHFNPQDLEAYLKKAIALRHISGKLQASLACFDKVIQSKDPVLLAECFEGLVDVGDMIQMDFQPEAVLAFTDRLIQVKPDYIAAYELKIRVLAYYKRYEESIACFEKMLDVTGVNTSEDRSKAFYNVVINYSESSKHTSPPPFRGKPIRDIDYKAAVLFLERAIQLDPNNQQAYYIKTDSMLILASRPHNFSTLEEMLDFGEKMVNKSPENIYLFEDGILLFCSKALVYDRFTDVIKQTNKLLLAPGLDLETLTKPDSLYCYKGLALSALGNHQEAIACFDKAIAIEQKFELLPYALGFKAELLVTLGQLEAAIKCIDDLNDNSLYPLQYSRGVVFAAAGRTEEAIKCFDEVANDMKYEVYKSHVPTVYLLRKELDILISLGQHEKAAEYSVWAAKELENSEEYDKAFELYDKAIEVYLAGDGFELKGNLLVKLGRYEAALAEMNKAIQANPKNPGYYLLKGKLLHVLGKTEAALPSFDEAMQRSEEVSTYANEKGIILYMLGQYEAAIACFDESLKTGPEYSECNNKGLALYALGQYEKAISCFDEGKPKFKSYFKEIDLYQHFLHKGRALAGLRQFDEALSNFTEALVITETFHYEKFFVLFYKGEVLSRLGKETEASDVFDEAYEIAYGSRNCEPLKILNSRSILEIEATKQRVFTYKEREALFRPLTQMQQAIVEVEDIILKLKQEKGETGAHAVFIQRFNKLKEEKNTLIGKCANRIDDYSRNISGNNDGLIKDMTCLKEQIDSLLKDICTPPSISKSKETAPSAEERKTGESKSRAESKKTGKSKDVGKTTTEKTSRCNMW